MMVRKLYSNQILSFENLVFKKCFHYLGECCTRVEVYYKNKTKAYERRPDIYGSYTRVFGDDVNDRYYYQSNFADGYYDIFFCGTIWFIGYDSKQGGCSGPGFANSNLNIDKCVHDIDFDWVYSDPSVAGWLDAGEGLAVKCLYEPGNC